MAKTSSNPEVISREAIGAILAGRHPERTWDPDTPRHGGNHVLLGEAVQYALDPPGWRARRLAWYAAQESAGLYGAEAAGGYRGYWLEGWLMDLRTAHLAGHEDVAQAALRAIRARIAIETLCETSAGRSIVVGSRTGNPWRGHYNDKIRHALRDGAPLPRPSDRFWNAEAALGAEILRDIIARELLPEAPLGSDEKWLPRLRWEMTVAVHANGFIAEIPSFAGRIEGAPWFSATVVGDEVVDSVSWRDDPKYQGVSHNRIFHSNEVDARAPRPPRAPQSLGAHRRTVRLGPGAPGPEPKPPPAPKPKPPAPKPPEPKPPVQPQEEGLPIPPKGLHIKVPQGERVAVLRLLPGDGKGGRWEFLRWHK